MFALYIILPRYSKSSSRSPIPNSLNDPMSIDMDMDIATGGRVGDLVGAGVGPGVGAGVGAGVGTTGHSSGLGGPKSDCRIYTLQCKMK